MKKQARVVVVSLIAGAISYPAYSETLKPGRSLFTPEGIVEQVGAAAAAQPGNQPGRVSVLVHLAPAADRGPVRAFAANVGGRVKYEYSTVLPNVVNLRGVPVDALNALLGTPGVVRWEEDKRVQAHMNDSTPLIRALQSQITGAGLSADGSGVRVCILDTGIDSDSAMYSARIDAAAGRDFVNNDNDPEDDGGHGSHVAGTAVGGDSLTVDFGCVGSEPFHGVAPEATLIGIKVLDDSGGGSFSDVIAGIDYGADQTASGGRCDVMNLSLGGGAFSGTCDGDSAAAAANNAVDAGVVVVASSGNEANSNAMGTPACASKVIAVGATYDDDYPNCEFPDLTSFEFCVCVNIFCCGTCTDNSPSVDQITCMSNRSTELDVTAPGCVTFSADFENSPNGIVGFCGTSMASPHTAGLAALLLSADPSLTPAEVRQHIRDGAIDLGASGFDTVYGWGRIDAINSLSLLGPECTTNGDCDDGDVCNGSETCVSGSCQAGTPLNCDDGDACTADSCDPASGCSNDPISCDDGDPCTTDSCDPGSGCVNTEPPCQDGDGCCPTGCSFSNDNDCPACDNDGTCESGEDCNNCPNDCISGSGGESCGDGTCNGSEDCLSCPGDCNGTQNGNPNGRFCCNADGGNDGQNPVDCNDSRCNSQGFSCGGGGGDPYCCGDGTCEGGEDSFNCAVDCGDPPSCGDGTCDPGEDECSCSADCGAPPSTETNCSDGVDEDCDGLTDCDDADCDGDPACDCGGNKAPCSSNADCCSGNCNGGSCRGN